MVFLILDNAATEASHRPVEAARLDSNPRAESRVRSQAERLADGHCALAASNRANRAPFSSPTRQVEYRADSVTVTATYEDRAGTTRTLTVNRRC